MTKVKKLEGFMKGINLGGWISQGENNPDYINGFITEDDIKRIASWKVDHVRLPVDYDIIQDEDENPSELGHKCIENCIEWCKKYGLNIVLDLHKTAGYVFDDQEGSSFFESEKLQERFYRIWEDLAKRYSKHKDMLILELLNEVVDPSVAVQWNEIAAKAIKIIREISKDVRIIVGGVENNAVTSIILLDPPADENIIYTFHCYEPLIYTHQGAYWIETMPLDFRISYPASFEEYMKNSKDYLADRAGFLLNDKFGFNEIGPDFFEKLFREAIEVAAERNVALYCGEYGVIDRADPKESIKWYRDINSVFEKYGIGRAAWTYKEKDFGLIGPAYDEIRDEIIELL